MWCWHHINENPQGKCPACRALYAPEGFEFTAPDPKSLQTYVLLQLLVAAFVSVSKSNSLPFGGPRALVLAGGQKNRVLPDFTLINFCRMLVQDCSRQKEEGEILTKPFCVKERCEYPSFATQPVLCGRTSREYCHRGVYSFGKRALYESTA